MTYAQRLAKISLAIGAIKLQPRNPFTWASGYRMPIYNDNRLLLGQPEHRALVAEAMQSVMDEKGIPADTVAGVATAGIPHATSLANRLSLPLIYVRSTPKVHGMKNQIEGILHPGQQVVVIEDLISTGGSAIKAIEAIRQVGGRVSHCLSIFSYGFTKAQQSFEQSQCQLLPLLTLEVLLQFARESGKINAEDSKDLEAWAQNPFEWGDQQKP